MPFRPSQLNYVVAMVGDRFTGRDYNCDKEQYLRFLPTPRVYDSFMQASRAAERLAARYGRTFVVLTTVGLTRQVPTPTHETISLPSDVEEEE